MTTLKALEEEAVLYHETTFAEGTAVCRDGIDILLRGFDAINGRDVRNDTERVQAALLIRAWNTVYCAFDLALRGYYPQSLNLLRTPIEDWMAYWYLRSFPDEHSRFLGQGKDTPKFKYMLDKLQEKHGEEATASATVSRKINRLHKFSHVDRLGVMMAILPGSNALNLALGPQQYRLRYLVCVEQVLTVILDFLEALDNFRRVLGCQPIVGFQQHAERVHAWQREQAEKAGKGSAPDPNAEDEDREGSGG